VLSVQARSTLLALSKKALLQMLDDRQIVHPDLTALPTELHKPAPIFVTLRLGSTLRGCLGHLQCTQPLAHEVMDTVVASATEDPRFEPLTKDEFPALNVEISVLSPFQRTTSPIEIIPGQHGVMVQRGLRKGLFLPQVWHETGWDKEKFLSELCQTKTGLPAIAWKDPDTELWIFTAVSFGASITEIPEELPEGDTLQRPDTL
jgi:AmmeMemoRadiSam system protein A